MTDTVPIPPNASFPLIRRVAERAAHSPTLSINEGVAARRARGEDTVHFGFGESPFPVPRPVREALRKHAGDNRYLPTQGLPLLREAVAGYLAKRFGHDARADCVLIGPGSKELLFHLMLVLDGDLILPAPSWVSYAPQGGLAGKRVLWISADPDSGWRLDPAALDLACERSRSRQKLLVLNSPCNPTGAVYSEDELRGIADVARRRNLVVVSDEIYAEVVFAQGRFASIARFCPERCVVTTGLSKGFSAGGYRLGAVMAPREMASIVPRLVSVASETFSCVSAPVQRAACAAFGWEAEVSQAVRDGTAIHEIAGEYLWGALCEMGLRCPRPEGAFYLFTDFSPFREPLQRRGVTDDASLCASLLREAGVAVLPGSAFGVGSRELAVRVATVDYDGAAALAAFRKRRPRAPEDRSAFVEAHCPRLAEGARRIEEYLKSV